MAEIITKKYVNLEELTYYDTKIKTYVDEVGEEYDAAGTAATAIAGLEGELSTVAKSGKAGDVAVVDEAGLLEATNVEGALAEIAQSIKNAGAVTITESTPEGYAKAYTISQAGKELGTINIPKDMVVSGGRIVENPDAEHTGKYIELTIANNDGTKLYIAVSDLVQAYSVQASATQIQLAISSTNEISATIVPGSVGTNELANKSVTTEKLSDALQTSIGDIATAKSNITNLQGRVETLESVEYVPITNAEIDALFATPQA